MSIDLQLYEKGEGRVPWEFKRQLSRIRRAISEATISHPKHIEKKKKFHASRFENEKGNGRKRRGNLAAEERKFETQDNKRPRGSAKVSCAVVKGKALKFF